VGLVCTALTVYSVILLIRVIFSWVQAYGGHIPPALDPAVRAVYQLTEPVLRVVRRYIPPVGMFDLSVLVVFILIAAVQRVICP
jgi:YggT family protein